MLPAVVSIESRVKHHHQDQRQPQVASPPPTTSRRSPTTSASSSRRRTTTATKDPTTAPLGFGSGFLVDPKGVVLTNYHVVDGADEVEVELQRRPQVRLARTSRPTPRPTWPSSASSAKEPLPYLEFGDSDAMEIGDRVLAVGAPFGLTGTVTSGIISAKGRNLHMNMYEDFLQTDAAINPGNSGGPLVNLDGKVIGINSAIKSRSGGFQGVGLAIASQPGQEHQGRAAQGRRRSTAATSASASTTSTATTWRRTWASRTTTASS